MRKDEKNHTRVAWLNEQASLGGGGLLMSVLEEQLHEGVGWHYT